MRFETNRLRSKRSAAWITAVAVATISGLAILPAAFAAISPFNLGLATVASLNHTLESSGDDVAVTEMSPTATARRVVIGDNEGGEESAAGVGGDLVYSNTGGTLLFPPGANTTLGDDLRTIAGCGCTLSSYLIRVGGGGDGTGPGFTVSYALYDECPELGGTILPGTTGMTVLPDDGDFEIVIEPTSPIAIPRRLWVTAEFDRAGAGWYVGSPASAGVTGDQYYFENFSCDAVIGSGFYAGFHTEVFCETDGGPGPAGDPVPINGAINVNPTSVLVWDPPGSFSPTSVPGPESPNTGGAIMSDEVPEIDPTWADPVIESGASCGTHERWLAKTGGVEGGNVAGGCGTLGSCDVPAIRDSFIPDATTPENVYRLYFHIFCSDSGTGCTSSVSEVNAQATTMRNNFDAYRISFEHEIAIHNDTDMRDWDGSEEGQLKSQYAVDPAQILNIYIVNVSGSFSFGTFPWDPAALTFMGGVVMNNGQFSSSSSTPTHEVGHNLGLWHTHHGVSEVNPCSACYESPNTNDSTVGDRCADTRPTPTNFSCGNPGGTDSCTGQPWGATDFTNHMSYSGCRTNFSSQQSGRMHCWTDDVLTSWLLAQCGATYDVYFGSTNPPTNLICDDVTDPTCAPGPLDCGLTYYWRVDVTSTETGGTSQGPVWQFTTPTGPDCNSNGTADVCDITSGSSEDCNANGQPDECEPDCQPNDVADDCDISSGNSADCNFNGEPDECEPDDDGDNVPNACDICAGGDDAIDSDSDGVPDFCDICEGGNDNVDTDSDGVPDFCDQCPVDNPDDPDSDGICTIDDNCALFNPEQLDCQPNGVGDVCDLDSATSTDDNTNDIPDECEIAEPFAEDSLGVSCGDDSECANEASCIGGRCYAQKTRYVSIDANPANASLTARRIALDLGGGALTLGWVGEPDANNVSRVEETPFYADWSTYGVVHVGDCHISPGRLYEVQAIPVGADIGNESNYSTVLALPTVAVFGDVGGTVSEGTLLPPDGAANFGDIQAVVTGFQGGAQAPTTWLDLEGEEPNFSLGLADVQQAVFGFQSTGYVYDDPCSCAGLAPCP